MIGLVVVAVFALCTCACSLVFSAEEEQGPEVKCLTMPSDVDVGVEFCSSALTATSEDISTFQSTNQSGLAQTIALLFNPAPDVLPDGAISFFETGAEGSDQGIANECNTKGELTIELVITHREEGGDNLLRFVEFRRLSGSGVVAAFGVNGSGTKLIYFSNDAAVNVPTEIVLDTPLGEDKIHHVTLVESTTEDRVSMYLDGAMVTEEFGSAKLGEWQTDQDVALVVGDTHSFLGGEPRSWSGDIYFLGMYCDAFDSAQVKGRYRELDLQP